MFNWLKNKKTLSLSDINKMKIVGRLVGQTLELVSEKIHPGMTTNEVDKIVNEFTIKNNAKPAPLGYKGFPKSICTSVNETLCHGVPSSYVLQEGDIVNVDVTTVKWGLHADASYTFLIGSGDKKTKNLLEVARKARDEGIKVIKHGIKTGDIGHAIESYVRSTGFQVCEEIGGHGIGRKFHDEPFVPSVGPKNTGKKISKNQCITVEPVINISSTKFIRRSIPDSSIYYYENTDRSISAQFEHTVLVTENSYEIITAHNLD
mgnify:CR=1 FL=1